MRFGAGIITVAGSLGILMLPSIPKVIYAVSTNTSIGELFVAGLLPGTLLTTMLVRRHLVSRRASAIIRACRRRRWAETLCARSARASGA